MSKAVQKHFHLNTQRFSIQSLIIHKHCTLKTKQSTYKTQTKLSQVSSQAIPKKSKLN